MNECVYNLADDYQNYYKKSTWQQELKILATLGSVSELMYFTDDESFYRQHKKDIDRLSPTGNPTEAVRKMAREIYTDTMSTILSCERSGLFTGSIPMVRFLRSQ